LPQNNESVLIFSDYALDTHSADIKSDSSVPVYERMMDVALPIRNPDAVKIGSVFKVIFNQFKIVKFDSALIVGDLIMILQSVERYESMLFISNFFS
jgi:hypothetical protein